MRDWEEANIREYGWFVHFIVQDAETPTGFDAHTHGLRETCGHLDFQIVIPLPEKVAHGILINLADRVKAGEKFVAEQTVADVLANDLLVKLIEATEGGRQVLRVILPDKKGKVEFAEISEPYVKQYEGCVRANLN
jgi:hypothetical protein